MAEGSTNDLVTGRELLDFSREAEGKPRYGRIAELFPFIYEASKRIGVREISRWLAMKGQPVSHSTISRALAKPETHWRTLAEQIEPHARLLKEGFDLPDYEFLFGPATLGDFGVPEEFSKLVAERFLKRVEAGGQMTDEQQRRFDLAEPCEKYLGKFWWVLSVETREHCRKYFPKGNPKSVTRR